MPSAVGGCGCVEYRHSSNADRPCWCAVPPTSFPWHSQAVLPGWELPRWAPELSRFRTRMQRAPPRIQHTRHHAHTSSPCEALCTALRPHRRSGAVVARWGQPAREHQRLGEPVAPDLRRARQGPRRRHEQAGEYIAVLTHSGNATRPSRLVVVVVGEGCVRRRRSPTVVLQV